MDTPKALVIDDDPDIIETVADTLASLGHEYASAASQQEARGLLEADSYDYVLLDLQIPCRARGGLSRIQNGENLLTQIRETYASEELPVIVITGHGKDGPELAVEMMKRGATDYVTKPFLTYGQRTLDKAIRAAVEKDTDGADRTEGDNSSRFRGGKMVFYEDRVELCGVKILGDMGMGYSRKMLELLARKQADGRFVAMTARQIADEIDCRIGDATIIGCVATVRSNIGYRLGDQLGLQVDPARVLVNNEQGYHLHESIVVERLHDGGDMTEMSPPDVPAMSLRDSEMSLPDVPAMSPRESGLPYLNQRQKWILSQLGEGVELTRHMVESQFRVTRKTAKRDFADLRRAGLTEFVRSPRPGHYRLKQA
jgi:CheY-like chemotaxis protein